MYEKKITFKNFLNQEKTKTYLFHLSKVELTRLEVEFVGGLEKEIDRLVESQNGHDIMHFFERVILLSYGEISEDGDSFVKSKERTSRFEQSAAYAVLFEELVTKANAATEFVNGIVPQK